VAVSIYDVAGQRVRTLHSGTLGTGETSVRWDGRDDDGRKVAAGVYWVRATDGIRERAAKLVRMR
jgi:flagellar hook assembly protein FlgD